MFYIFHGEDRHSQQEALAKLVHKMGDPSMLELNTTRLNGSISLDQLQQATAVPPFLAKYRLVLVYDLFAAKLEKPFVDKLVAYLPQLPETTRLFFLEGKPLASNHALVKAAEKAENGFVRRFDKPEGAALEKWIREQVAERHGRIHGRAVQQLAINAGNNLQLLANELDKLILYKGGDQEISSDDVALLSPYAAEASIFDLVDALGNRNSKRASLLLQQKFSEGADPFYLFTMIVRQFRLLIQVKALAEKGEKAAAIGQTLKLHSFVAGKLYQQSQGFSLSQLKQIYQHLLEIDIGSKTGRQEMPTALSLLVANLTLTL